MSTHVPDRAQIEANLFEALQLIAPGKYRRISYEQRVKCPANHLKGGRTGRAPLGKDYNLSVFTFPTGVTEIKCLYNCGLKVRSDEGRKEDFEDLVGLMKQSTNSRNSSEWRIKRNDPGPTPVYTDKDRQRIRENAEMLWKWLEVKTKNGEDVSGYLAGSIVDHPDPVEAPESIVERQLKSTFRKAKIAEFQKAVAEDEAATWAKHHRPPVEVKVSEPAEETPEPCKTTVSKRKTKSRRIKVG